MEDAAQLLDPDCHQYLVRIRKEAQRMGQLIDALLQLSRLGRSTITPAVVNLSALAKTIAQRCREAAPGRNLEFVIEEGLTATADPRLMEAVLVNLLENAVKFTASRPVARIEVGAATDQVRECATGAAFYVRDNGAGFDEKYADKLFGPFQRLHRASEYPGTGIGLATAQRIVRRHGGEVWARGEVDRGATFYFSLNEAR